ncbi:P-loop containing nucleoside triphosphate hydrolase protein [Mycena galopus ATCC 62051]|nr:P-loop containing nucleoside triphosphate hydrolase protein [Mycena galopus ATCC 62051]
MELWINVLLFPLQVALAIWFLYLILGWSSFVGLAVILITLPLPSYLARIIRICRYLLDARYLLTDARVQQVTETMNVLRMIKWFAWESKIKEDIAAKREEELIAIRNIRFLAVLNNSINFVIPLLVMLATFSTYTLVMRQQLTASIVFSSLAVFDGILRQKIRAVMNEITHIIKGKVSLDRVDNFLRTTELLDLYSFPNSSTSFEHDAKIGFRDAEFSWSNQVDTNGFKLRIGSEIIFKPGVINLIVGSTGVVRDVSQFTRLSLNVFFAGEMHFTPAGPNPWVNLPRQGGVAYASQQPWIENATIRQNIVFNTDIPFDAGRYKRVLHACALNADLELLDARDETEVGERGLTLSLARAIYSNASTILLDDVLSSLDIHTANWIVQHCLSTHNIALTRPISQWVVSLNSDGSITHGPVETVLKVADLSDLEDDHDALEEGEKPGTSDITDVGAKGKLTVAEKSQHGLFPRYCIFMLVCGLFLLNETTTLFQFWFLGFWSSQYLDRPASSVPVRCTYLGIYSGTVALAMVLYITAHSLYASGTMRSAKIIHAKLIDSVMVDTTPMSRVITRATQDINKVTSMLAKFSAVIILNPVFIVPGGIIAILSRQMSAARSPMLAHFAAAIAGLTSIRAYGAENAFLLESATFWGGVLRGLGWYLIYGGGPHGPADVGFSLSAAISFTATILWWVRVTNAFQLDGRIFLLQVLHLERVADYIGIEQEQKPTPAGVPPAYWPASGEIRAENLSAKYSSDGPEILHGLNFAIKSGERIAVVGRTGSGKSSLTLSLLRCILTEGEIYYDGIPINTLNLNALRSNITIIPQVPELLGGSLRRNLDPFEAHDDLVLTDALRAAGLFSLQTNGDGKKSSLSLDKRQIVALARAIIRGSKLLILDEATSAIGKATFKTFSCTPVDITILDHKQMYTSSLPFEMSFQA